MSLVVAMPAVSPTMTHGSLVTQLKQPGDVVAVGDVVAEIESDKAIVELESDVNGVIERWLVAEGTEEIPVGTALVQLVAADSAATPAPTAQPARAAAAEDVPSAATISAEAESGSQAQPATPTAPATSAAPAAKSAADNDNVVALPSRAPSAKRTPTSTPATASGTGSALSQAIARQLQVPGDSVATLLNQIGPAAAPEVRHPVAPPRSRAPASPVEIDAGELAIRLGMPHERVSASSTRRVIAERMTRAKRDVPHFYLTSECGVDRLQKFRAALNEAHGQTRVSVNDLLVRIAALSLAQHPDVNVAWIGPDMIHYDRVDVAVAVATPGGLLTPVIRDAAQSDVRTIASTMADLGERARNGRLNPNEMAGGTITLSNLGMYGVREAVAVINPPQASILAIGAAEEHAVVEDGQLAIGRRMRCTLSVDHRAIDGAVAARFLATFKEMVENPEGLT